MGGRHVIPESGGFDPDEVLNLGRQLDNVVMFAAPTMVRRLVDAAKKRGENGEGLRTIIYGGGPMYTADIRTRSPPWASVLCRSTARVNRR